MGKKEFMRVFIWLLSLQDILVNFKTRWEQNSPNRFDEKKIQDVLGMSYVVKIIPNLQPLKTRLRLP